MKAKYLFMATVSVLLASCATENRVKKITFDNVTHAPTFYGEKKSGTTVSEVSIAKEDAVATEGSDIVIEVINFNPLNNSFTLQQDVDALFYISAATTPETLTKFMATAYGPQVIPDTPAPNPSPGPRTADKKSKKVTPPANDPNKCNLISQINNNEKTLLHAMGKFNKYYAAITALNDLMESYKTYPTIDEKLFFCDIDNAVNEVRSSYLNTVAAVAPFDCAAIGTGSYTYKNSSQYLTMISERDAYVSEFESKVTALENDIKANEALKTKCTSTNSELSTSVAQNIKKAKVLMDDINTKLSSNITSVSNKLKSLNSLKFKFYPSQVHVGETDEVVLKISVKDNALNDATIYSFAHLPVYKSMKIDYSAGAFFCGLYDETYHKTVATTTDNTIDPPVDTNHYTLHSVDGGGSSFGAMGFINFHTQFATACNYGFSLGAGLRFNQSTKLVLCPTISLFIGKYQRFIIHAGVAVSQVDRIYSQYGEESFTSADYTPETRQIVKGSPLIGFSWNLSRTK